jgi:ABC-2 type transport system ATP-binding protein
VQLPAVISASQLGASLRVLVSKSENNPIALLRKQPSIIATDKLAIVRPSLEDVFVSATGKELRQ